MVAAVAVVVVLVIWASEEAEWWRRDKVVVRGRTDWLLTNNFFDPLDFYGALAVHLVGAWDSTGAAAGGLRKMPPTTALIQLSVLSQLCVPTGRPGRVVAFSVALYPHQLAQVSGLRDHHPTTEHFCRPACAHCTGFTLISSSSKPLLV